MSKYDTHYGHWRGTLQIAAELARQPSFLEERQLALSSATVILSHTALEIYLNECWFASPNPTMLACDFNRYQNKRLSERYRKNILACENCDSVTVATLFADISFMNLIRNFCVHYKGPHIDPNIIEGLKCRNLLFANQDISLLSPQSAILTKNCVAFCVEVTVRSILFHEQNRPQRNVMTDDYVNFCTEMLQ